MKKQAKKEAVATGAVANGAAAVKVGEVKAAAWNVHGDPKEDAELKGLAQSMRETGLVQRITVRRLADGGYEVIVGHRRLAAAKRLCWEYIPANVVEADDATAQLMTATANVQRTANDPLLEADLVGRLRDAGLSFAEIGAAIGRDERYAARRARLLALTDNWREWFKQTGAGADSAALMETVAAHEADLQDAVFEDHAVADDDGELIDADEVRDWFDREMRKLDEEECPFDLGECARCESNTATHGLLFPEMAEGCGRCQDARCFATRWNGAVDAEIERLRKKGVEVKAARDKWSIPHYWDATPHRERRNVTPFVFEEGGLKKILWTDAEDRSGVPAKTEAELAEERRVKAARAKWSKLRKAAFDKARAALKSDDADEVAAMICRGDEFLDEMKRKYAKMIKGFIPDEEVRLIVRVCGAGTFEIGADEADALEAEDPFVVAEREARARQAEAAEAEAGEEAE